jgi:hypothetical protein
MVVFIALSNARFPAGTRALFFNPDHLVAGIRVLAGLRRRLNCRLVPNQRGGLPTD